MIIIKQKGFTLIELMVTLVISSILLLGTISVLINNFDLSRANDRYARLNENTLMAANFISQDLDMVGYTGCANRVDNNIPAPANDGDLLHLTAAGVNGAAEIVFLDGLDDSNKIWRRFGSNQITASILDGTDAITIRKIRNQGAMLTADMAAVNSAISANLSTDNLATGDLIAISDCRTLDITAVDNPAANNITTDNDLSNVYTTVETEDDLLSQAGRVAVFDVVRYFIGTDANGQAGLWREILPGNTAASRQELVKGVENMQILYGITGSGSANRSPVAYVTANTLVGNAWRDVVSVKFALLVTSNFVSTGGDDSLQNEEENQDFLDYKNDQIANGAQHVLLDQNIPWSADNVIRRVVTREVFFRNQQYKLK